MAARTVDPRADPRADDPAKDGADAQADPLAADPGARRPTHGGGPPSSTAAGGPATEPGTADLLPDTVRSLYGQGTVALIGNLLGAVVLAVIFAGVAPSLSLIGWELLFALIFVLRVLTLLAYRRAGDTASTAEARAWQRRWTIGAICSAAAWGLASLLFFGHGSAFHQTTLLLTVYSYCVGSIPSLASQYRSFLAYIALCFGPMIVRLCLQGDAESLKLAGVLALVLVMSAMLGRAYRRTFDHAIELKVRTERLAAQLQVQKAAAEESRRIAEAANRAKTQFFSAASHDLRQPLHAMGLFAEALRAKSRGDEEVTHLVNSINSSVDALEGLFGELLDITKIDTGGVEPQPEHFALRELFQRFRLQYEPTAFEKGLALRFRGAHRAVYADPVLVDRVVRNLLSNAIRYTVDGGVLVSARQRGEQVLVQVWDTGIGIATSEQPRIFDEFYQVHGGPPLQADQAKGLGLGLSIVQRLAHLMGAPLALDSVPGRGTVFTLTLPLGKPPRARLSESSTGKPVIGLTLERKRVVVVEDEPAVREGLSVLLRGWGAQVDAFESLAALQAWTSNAPPAPDLAIVDYRLPEGRTGMDALALLRERFGASLPAIVVTGSTMTGHEDESTRHDFHLLIKPVAPNKLRAMIAFKLGLR